MAKLKPCPFCGSKPTTVRHHTSIKQYITACSRFGCPVSKFPRDYKTKKQAIQSWNRRVDDGEEEENNSNFC
jgi:Lar family restriction alleviation protein